MFGSWRLSLAGDRRDSSGLSQPLFDGGIDLEPSSVEQVLGSLKTRVPVSKRGRFWESVLTTEGGKKCSEFLKCALPPGRVAAEALNAFELSDYPAHPLKPIQSLLSSCLFITFMSEPNRGFSSDEGTPGEKDGHKCENRLEPDHRWASLWR